MKAPTSDEAHRDLVADHLARGAEAAEERELVVAAQPAIAAPMMPVPAIANM